MKTEFYQGYSGQVAKGYIAFRIGRPNNQILFLGARVRGIFVLTASSDTIIIGKKFREEDASAVIGDAIQKLLDNGIEPLITSIPISDPIVAEALVDAMQVEVEIRSNLKLGL